MSNEEIRNAIQNSPELLQCFPDTEEIARRLSIGRTKLVPKLGGVGVIMEALGPVRGASLLDTLDSLREVNSPVKWSWVLINRGELDFGSPTTIGMINLLSQAGIIPEEDRQILTKIAEVPDIVSKSDVDLAIHNERGFLLLVLPTVETQPEIIDQPIQE